MSRLVQLRLKKTRGVRVLDLDSLVLFQQDTSHELSFWEYRLLELQKFFKKNASTSFIASFLHQIEVALFCSTNNDQTNKEIDPIKCLSDDFFLIIATKKSFDELKKTSTFQYIIRHIAPEYLLVDGLSDGFAGERFNDFLSALGNKTTRVLAAKTASDNRAFLYPLLEWAGEHNVSLRKIILVSDDASLCRTAKYCSVGTKGSEWFSLFASCPA